MTAKKTQVPARRATLDPRQSSAPSKDAPKSASPPASAGAATSAADPIRDASFGRRDTHRDARQKANAVMVECHVPRAFKHINEDRILTDYPAGQYELPRGVCEDSFVVAMGVTPVAKK